MVIKRFKYRLFLTYFTIILIVILLLSSVSYYFLSNILKDVSFQSLKQQTINISSEMEAIVRDMDRIVVYIATSSEIKELIDERNKGARTAANEMDVENIISGFLSPWFSVRQVNLFNHENFLSFGVNDYRKHADSYKIAEGLIESISNLNGGKYLREPEIFSWNFGDEALFSLCRSFKIQDGIIIVEVQQQLKKIERIINNSIMDEASQVFIITDDGRLLYPIGANPDSFEFYNEVRMNNETATLNVYNPIDEQQEIIFIEHSNYMELKVIVSIEEDKLLSPVRRLSTYTILLVIIFLVVTFAISLRVAKVITVPIDRIKSITNNLEVNNLHNNFTEDYPEMGELKQLFFAFENMQLRIDKSIKELINSKEQENKANLIAYQSQINPHFLYNTLTVIGSKGYENCLPVIDEMCNDLSYMLRYLTDDSSFSVEIEKELGYSIRYLNLMKKRYEERLEYHIDIDSSMNSIKVPKLILQPLIENCITHGLRGDSIAITVKGEIEENIWKITVSDNGKGIPENNLESIKEKFKQIVDNMEISEIVTNKVGLMNTFIRMNLFCKSDIIFDIQSSDEGTSITIGGKINV